MIDPKCPTHKSLAHKAHAFACGIDRLTDRTLQTAMDVSFSHLLILMALADEESLSQKQIANFRNVTEAAISRHIEHLTSKKLIRRKLNPANRREHLLSLTPHGKRTLDQAHTRLEEIYEHLFKALSKDERRSFVQCLDKLLAEMCPKKLCAIEKPSGA